MQEQDNSLSERFIWVITTDRPIAIEGSKGLGDNDWNDFIGGNQSLQRVQVSLDRVEQEMTNLLKGLSGMLDRVQQSVGDVASMGLDQVTLSVEVNAQGQVSLFGIGGQTGGKGAITLTFKRSAAGS
ncbi:MAG: hypothetical protein MUF72_20545 [Elainella sp. Prado103]|jgi:hypothetical protein|nr:hypothetical protein [Elainella sp. Prado103]